MTGIRPDVGHIRQLGNWAFAQVPLKFFRGQLAKHARLVWVVGYLSDGAYIVHVLNIMCVIIAKNVLILEMECVDTAEKIMPLDLYHKTDEEG